MTYERQTNFIIDQKSQHVLFTDAGVVPAVNDVSFDIHKGETVGLVGESGCGKSVTAHSIMRLIPEPPGKIVAGQIWMDDCELTSISMKKMRAIRGNDISMIFQEPMTSLNPVLTVGQQIIESVQLHTDKSMREARDLAIQLLDRVGIPSPQARVDEYPHQLSGGMKQRVMIAMALVCKPKLVIADEPTTALDVTIQAQILDLLRDLQSEYGLSILLITHDLGVIAEMAHRVVVMYASKVVETADNEELFYNPRHPYTAGLFRSIPKIDEDKQLVPIPGMVPPPQEFPSGCKFHPRCRHCMKVCKQYEPPLIEVGAKHRAACWLNAFKEKRKIGI